MVASLNNSLEGDLSFNILAKCDRAREGIFRLPHGDVATPVFMPVGTQGTIKGLCPRQIEETGCKILLCNTYHLGHRPGHVIVEKAGGIHKMMDWKYNILTDSGGFQMVSLDSMMKVDEEGVNFRSPHNGEQMLLTPEHSINIQQALGSDIMMQLDHVVSSVSDDSDFKEPMERSVRWLDRCDKVHNNRKKQILFPIIQGGLNFELRKECIDKMVQYAEYGIAIGGLSGGEEKEGFWKTVDFCCKHLPEKLPKYVMGVGWQTDMVLCALSGADMFDCVYPTRTARFGTALVFENANNGELHLNRQIYKRDFRLIEEDCTCRTCKNYTRAFIHASIGKEAVACHLLTVHNIHHQLELMKRLRKAINTKNVGEFLKNFIDGQFSGIEKCPPWAKMAIEELGYGPIVFGTSKPEISEATNGV
jgi:tRNA-guanine transglycosylase